MHCPRPSCLAPSPLLRSTKTQNESNTYATDRPPIKYRGINMTRRLNICTVCGHKFATIEITENDYELNMDRSQFIKTAGNQ